MDITSEKVRQLLESIRDETEATLHSLVNGDEAGTDIGIDDILELAETLRTETDKH